MTNVLFLTAEDFIGNKIPDNPTFGLVKPHVTFSGLFEKADKVIVVKTHDLHKPTYFLLKNRTGKYGIWVESGHALIYEVVH